METAAKIEVRLFGLLGTVAVLLGDKFIWAELTLHAKKKARRSLSQRTENVYSIAHIAFCFTTSAGVVFQVCIYLLRCQHRSSQAYGLALAYF